MFKRIYHHNHLLIFALSLIHLLTFSGCMLHPANQDYQSSENNAEPTAKINPQDISPYEPKNFDTTDNPEYSPKTPLTNETNLSTHMLVDEARELACTGALQYKDGHLDKAYANLEAAIFNLQLADLPEDMQSISFFQPYLPKLCGSVDLQKAYNN
ncbi:hypothetical protein K8T06_13200 [bacterium]|nr:hypothetical protein [bacterium]